MFPHQLLCAHDFDSVPCVEESLRRTAAQYHLANGPLKPQGAVDSQTPPEAIAAADVHRVATSNTAADDSPDIHEGGTRGEDSRTAASLKQASHKASDPPPCKKRKQDATTEGEECTEGMILTDFYGVYAVHSLHPNRK